MKDGYMPNDREAFDLIIRGMKQSLCNYQADPDLEASRLANNLRTLFDDKNKGSLIYKTLNGSIRSTINSTTASRPDLIFLMYSPLVLIGNKGAGYVPVFEDNLGGIFSELNIKTYLEKETIIFLKHSSHNSISRLNIIKAVANKTGACHYDSDNLKKWQRELLQDGLGVKDADGRKVKGFLSSLIAQIAYEVISTVDPAFRMKIQYNGVGVAAFITAYTGEQAIVLGIKKLKGSQRNSRCLCGSGLKYKKCHMRTVVEKANKPKPISRSKD